MAALMPEGKQSFIDSKGAPLVGGKLFTYDAGTSTPRITYQDAASTTPNTNPVVLDSRGEATIFWAGTYKVVLKNAVGTTVWSVDNVQDPDSSAGAGVAALRADLSSPPGASLVGFTTVGGVNTTTQAKLREQVSVTDFANLSAATNTQTRSTTSYNIPLGDYASVSQQSLAGYFDISGKGERSTISAPVGGGSVFSYVSHSGVLDDHTLNRLSGVQVNGNGVFVPFPGAQNGTTTGLAYNTTPGIGNLNSSDRVVYNLHGVGRHVKQSYGQSGNRNYYRANKVGLKLENVTSFTETNMYARYNSVAAVQILGGQNVHFIGGAIEGNSGVGLQYMNDPGGIWGQLNLTDVYFESNGNTDTGVPSIDIPFGSTTMVNIRGGNYWSNTASGVRSGPFMLGDSVSIEGANINAVFYAKEVIGYRNNRGASVMGMWNTQPTEALARVYGLTAPTLFHELKLGHAVPPGVNSSIAGSVISTAVRGRGSRKIPMVPDLSVSTYPYGVTSAAGVTLTADTLLNYGEGDFVKAAFPPSVGGFSTNYVTLFNHTDISRPYRAVRVLIRPYADCELGIIQSVGGQSIIGFYKFIAGKTYSVVCAATATMSAASFLRVFSLDTTAPSVSFLPVWAGQALTYGEYRSMLEMLVDGSL